MKQFSVWACAVALGITGRLGRAEDVAEHTSLFDVVTAQAVEHLHESFEYGSPGGNWGETLTRWAPSGRSYVGTGNSGETLTFKSEALDPHQAVLVRVKLFIIYHWDGNWTVFGPDLFRVQLDQRRELLRASFSNYSVVGQSYPDNWPWGEHPARTAAAETGTLGWKFPGGWGQPLDAVYDVWLGAVRRGGELQLEFRGDFHDAGDQQKYRGEQWGIESLDLHTFDQAIELPDATWETLAKNLLSDDAVMVAEARALLPLGDPERVIQALNHAAVRHNLDREALTKVAEAKEGETIEEALADTLEQAAAALRRRNGEAAQPREPSNASRAARLYQVLTLMEADRMWRSLLWKEMNDQRP